MTNYKSTRLLVEAIKREMRSVRKTLMRQADASSSDSIEVMNDLTGLIDQLAARANRVTLDDVAEMPVVEYVDTMKPLVAKFHQQLMVADRLTACLCQDLKVNACLLVLVGDGRTLVRTAHDPDHPEAALVVDTMLAAIDETTKQAIVEATSTAAEGVAVEDVEVRHADTCGCCGCPLEGKDPVLVELDEDEVVTWCTDCATKNAERQV